MWMPGVIRRRWLLLSAAALLVLSLVLLLSPARQAATGYAAPVVGHPAPDFTLPTLSGGRAALHQFAGHPVLLQFWAVHCESCAAERDALLKASRQFTARGGVVLGVDAYLEPAAEVRAYSLLHTLPYQTIWLDPDGTVVLGRYQLLGVPTSFFLTMGGVIRLIHQGQMSQSAFAHALSAISA